MYEPRSSSVELHIHRCKKIITRKVRGSLRTAWYDMALIDEKGETITTVVVFGVKEEFPERIEEEEKSALSVGQSSEAP